MESPTTPKASGRPVGESGTPENSAASQNSGGERAFTKPEIVVSSPAATPGSVKSPKSHKSSKSVDLERTTHGKIPVDKSAPNTAKATVNESPENIELVLMAVTFKEAALDSPSFRASTNLAFEVFDALDYWLDGFIKAATRLQEEMEVVQQLANNLISRFVPEFATQGILDQDYTVTVMQRYAEASKYSWTQILRNVNTIHSKTAEPLADFHRHELRSIKEIKKVFEAAQQRYDAALARYAALSKSKEPSSIREDAFQLYEARKSYIKVCFDVCCLTAQTQRKADTAFIDALADPWLPKPNSFIARDPNLHKLSLFMLRARSWTKAMLRSMPRIESEMLRARKEIESQVMAKIQPSRNLNVYSAESATISHFVPDSVSTHAEKHGWLFFRTPGKSKGNWHREWAFIRNGYFGCLQLSQDRSFVQETRKIGVLLCNVSPDHSDDRRFCFEVRTKDASYGCQAESLAEMKAWMQTFENSKKSILEDPNTSQETSSISTLFEEFDVTANPTGVHERPDSLIARGTKVLKDSGYGRFAIPFENGNSDKFAVLSNILTTAPFINAPMPTSMTNSAILSGMYSIPTSMPSSAMANVWGSVNWSLLAGHLPMLCQEPTIPRLCSSYPPFYPRELRVQDGQLRAIFQHLAEPDDLVLLTHRGMISASPKQELPVRTWITAKYVYAYFHAYGFVGLYRKELSTYISIEGKAATGWDTLYVHHENGQITPIRIFLDSGRSLCKRMQFLIDNAHALPNERLGLKELIARLQVIGNDPSSMEFIQGETAISGDDNMEEGVDRSIVEKYLIGDRKTSAVATTRKVESPEVVEVDLSQSMNHRIMKHAFDISAKALFHIMFGEKSTVFNYKESSLHRRENIVVTPWRLMSNNKMERQIQYDLRSNGVLMGGVGHNLGKSLNLQRIERLENNRCYIVQDRRSPWELPQGDTFFVSIRFAITATSKNSSLLQIWSSVEWIKSDNSFMRNVIESVIPRNLKKDGAVIVKRILEDRKRLGPKGGATTAIRLFGKIGGSSLEEVGDGATQQNDEAALTTVQLPHLGEALFRVISSTVCSLIMFSIGFVGGVPMLVWKQLQPHKLLILMLSVSVMLNVLLAGRSTVSYWVERDAISSSNSIHLTPGRGDILSRGVYLKDVDDLIHSGVPGIDVGSSCYGKFMDLVEQPTWHLKGVQDMSSAANVDENIIKLHQAREDIAAKRNDMLVSFRLLNKMEATMVIGEWERWLANEARICRHLERIPGLANDTKKILSEYCSDCLDQWGKIDGGAMLERSSAADKADVA